MTLGESENQNVAWLYGIAILNLNGLKLLGNAQRCLIARLEADG